MKCRKWARVGALHLALILGAGLVHAQAVPPALEACLSLRRDAERLACYDRAVEALKTGQEVEAASPENMFGAGEIRKTPTASDTPRDEFRQISATVTSVRRANDGKILVELDNGQVWRQQDSDVHMMISSGDTVTIARASMGTFRIADKTGRFARFKRVR